MKKTLFLFAAAAAFVLTGCTENDLAGDNSSFAKESNTAIEFSAKTRNAGTTRATGGATGNNTTTSLKNENHGFGVVAYHTNTTAWTDAKGTAIPNFMWNQKVAWNTTNSVWSYTPVKFWPNDFSTSIVDNQQGAGQDNNAYGSQNGGKVSFFAYAPYVEFPATSSGDTQKHGKAKVSEKSTADADGIVAMTANDFGGEPQVYYILNNADLNNAVDLLWGVRGNSSGYDLATQTATDAATIGDYNTDLTKQSVSENVNFLFKHALSKIGGHTATSDPAGLTTGLQVVLDLDNGSTATGVQTGSAIYGGTKQSNTLVTVKSIEIYDLKTANDNSLPGVTETTSDLVKEGWFNIATGSWSATTLSGSGATYSSTVGTGVSGDAGTLLAAIKEDNAGLAYNTETSTWSTTATTTGFTGVTTEPQDVYTNTSEVPALVLIPSNTNQHLVVRVEYVVRTYDSNLNASASGETNGTWTKVTQKITSKVTIPANALKANTYYKLLLHLGLTSVKFTASVCDWEDAANAGTNGNLNNNPNNDKDVYLPSNTLDTSSDAVTETVTTASVPAGSSKTYSVPANNGSDDDVSFTINLSSISTSATAITAVATGATTTTPTVTYTLGETSATITLTLPKNDSTTETQTTTVTVSSTGADQTTVVTLVQVPKVATP